jgi:2-polyprenyl-3-methyl-5-hydroxy-6-metoxy-1,4-benzoquinol methylase
MSNHQTIWRHPDALIRVVEGNGRRTISVEPRPGYFTPLKKWNTRYPIDLIDHVLRVKGPGFLCDEISRDENPRQVQHNFSWNILSYVEKKDFAGRRVLDFGSGSGASSMVLARMFPEANIVGVELDPEHVELARHRARFYGIDDRVRFELSPDSTSLPANIGRFDYIIFMAVYEHLLPSERGRMLPLVWSHLKSGGILFLDETPYRWFPIESHTTGLPLINYLPDRLTLYCSRWLSKRIRHDASWEELLREGIRGATTEEILNSLRRQGPAELLNPSYQVKDHIDLWYRLSSTTRRPLMKKFLMWSFRAVKLATGVTIIPVLTLAFKKG